MNTGGQAEQEVSNCSFGSFKLIEALWQPTKICAMETFYLQTFVPSGGQSLHQSTDLTPSFLFSFQIHYLRIYVYVECLGVLHCILSSLFSFSVLHACFYYFICLTTFTLHLLGFLLPTYPASTWTFPCQSFSCSYV